MNDIVHLYYDSYPNTSMSAYQYFKNKIEEIKNAEFLDKGQFYKNKIFDSLFLTILCFKNILIGLGTLLSPPKRHKKRYLLTKGSKSSGSVTILL